MMVAHDSLRTFVQSFARILQAGPCEATILSEGQRLLRDLVSTDDWLSPRYAKANQQRYQQYLLHCDSLERFSVVAFVWAGGQATPVHNHTVWGLIGMLRGAEISQGFTIDGNGLRKAGLPRRLEPGQVEILSPETGDIHSVSNAYTDRVSISIHVYGANIGSVNRLVFDDDGPRSFRSGYANAELPNIWRAVI